MMPIFFHVPWDSLLSFCPVQCACKIWSRPIVSRQWCFVGHGKLYGWINNRWVVNPDHPQGITAMMQHGWITALILNPCDDHFKGTACRYVWAYYCSLHGSLVSVVSPPFTIIIASVFYSPLQCWPISEQGCSRIFPPKLYSAFN